MNVNIHPIRTYICMYIHMPICNDIIDAVKADLFIRVALLMLNDNKYMCTCLHTYIFAVNK